ncbi:MAG: hypothetical protein WBE75_04675 [Candidatus Omnitrophota bacterium]
MRYKKVLLIAFSPVLLCVFLHSLFNINKLSAQTANITDREKSEIKALCVLGEKVREFPFYVYSDAESGKNNFFPTGYMGDSSSFKFDPYCREVVYKGKSCIKVTYNLDANQTYGWIGLYWQYPPNNWANIPKAYDLTGAVKLTFWARGEHGGEVISKFQVGGITGQYRDSGVASIGPVILSKKWKRYTIGLKNIDNPIIVGYEDKQCWPFMQPLVRVVGGFCWATNLKVNDKKGIVFYLDEIRFENK